LLIKKALLFAGPFLLAKCLTFLKGGNLMASSKGFSLLEIMIVLLIVGVLAAFVTSVFSTSIEQTRAATAQGNLLAIAAAEEKYYEDFGSFCTTVGACATNAGNINTNLHLSVGVGTDPFAYRCPNAGASYTCTAKDGATVTLTLTPGAQPPVTCTVGGNNCPYH
jgi:prepilin-type N-terminal cleavage/methylation domain-containing protein